MGLFRRRTAQVSRSEDPLGVIEPLAADAAPEEAEDLDVSRRVRPKLWARAEIAEHAAELELRPVADDLVAVLCLDLPTTVQNVRPEDVAATGLPVGELWERALTQLEDGEPVERMMLDEVLRIEVIASDSQFLAARVLDLEGLVGPVGPHGVLLALPHRHMVLSHPIEDGATLLDAARILAPVAARAHADGPGSLSPHLYWWQAGELERIPVDEADAEIAPPPAFAGLLEELARPHPPAEARSP